MSCANAGVHGFSLPKGQKLQQPNGNALGLLISYPKGNNSKKAHIALI